jgi:hypothetical protein
MQIILSIKADNAAFTDDPGAEVARILRDAAKHIERDGPHFRRLMDSNGNKVGEMDFTE